MLLINYKISLNFFRTLDETVLIKSNKDKYNMAQRVRSLKKTNQVDCYEHAFKVDRTSTFRGDLLGKRAVTLFRRKVGGGCNFHIKINQNIKI